MDRAKVEDVVKEERILKFHKILFKLSSKWFSFITNISLKIQCAYVSVFSFSVPNAVINVSEYLK